MNDARLADYLDHMRIAAADACSFVEGLAQDDFLADRRTQQAVVMSLIILGEAATKIMTRYPAFVEAHPDLPWRAMRGMRNRIAHGYFEINFVVVWDTVGQALPTLIAQLNALDRSTRASAAPSRGT